MIYMNTLLFDFDGTLVDSMSIYLSVMTRILDENNIEYDSTIGKTITPLGTIGTAKYFVELGVPMTEKEIVTLMGKYMLDEYLYNIPAKENVVDVLKTLKSNGYSLNILTASPHITLDACLKRLGIWELFSNVWSCDDFGTTKTDPNLYKIITNKLGVSAEDISFFDDNPNACATAKKAKMKVCGVFDETSQDYIDEVKNITDYYIYNFSEILQLNL